MKNKSIILSAILATAVLASCGKEELKNKQSDAALNFRSSSFPLTLNWEQGAINWEGETALAGGTSRTVSAFNNFLGAANQIGFARGTNVNVSGPERLGREANRTIKGAFTYKVTATGSAWTATVPFAFGHVAGNTSKEMIWTPSFKAGSNRLLNSGEFVTDNSTLDEDKTTGTIEVGDWRAVQLTLVDPQNNTRKRVSIQEKVGSNWIERVRPNNNNGLVEMRAFTVLNVRTGYSITGGVVGAPTYKAIPVLKSQLVGINNSISNGAIILWTLQPNGAASFNTEMFRP